MDKVSGSRPKANNPHPHNANEQVLLDDGTKLAYESGIYTVEYFSNDFSRALSASARGDEGCVGNSALDAVSLILNQLVFESQISVAAHFLRSY